MLPYIPYTLRDYFPIEGPWHIANLWVANHSNRRTKCNLSVDTKSKHKNITIFSAEIKWSEMIQQINLQKTMSPPEMQRNASDETELLMTDPLAHCPFHSVSKWYHLWLNCFQECGCPCFPCNRHTAQQQITPAKQMSTMLHFDP